MPDLARPTTTTRTGFLLVAAAAALWGTDGLFRFGLAEGLPGSTVVAAEHLILVVLMFPLLVRGARRARRTFSPGDVVALLLVGVGASAVATVLFTSAFAYGDPNTPLLLQQLQPVFAVLGARLLLGERLRRRFPVFFVAALAGAFLVAFPDPTEVGVAGAAPALLAASAALLWAMGTVLGRRLTAKVSFTELAALRFGVGLPAALALLPIGGGVQAATTLDGAAWLSLLLLALIPGLLGLVVYYRGLRGTPAASATLAELAFPLSSLVVNYVAFGAVLTTSQVVGVALLAGTIAVMGVAHQRRPEAAGVAVPTRSGRVETS
ncbi:DMT family transporter [Egibacter rhizosphaerae]|uniref:DMT family transporter n=1 Tax=Egibacter rhizosphaerae TaxID=1670831 RepID=UPI00197AD6C7|nr:EamA family transporter [Egibacter rhizosphaerae]